MANYQSNYTGEQIDKVVGVILNGLTESVDIIDILYNVKESQNETETLTDYTDFGVFDNVTEGTTPTTVNVEAVGSRTVEFIKFAKEICIPANMIGDEEKIVKELTRSYYRTRNMLACRSLAYCTSSQFSYEGTSIDLTSPDGFPVFSAYHSISTDETEQPNYFYATRGADEEISAELVEGYLARLSVLMREMKDENGDALHYEADTIILPYNHRKLETVVRKAAGDRWKIVVLPYWSAEMDIFTVMSSKANKELGGNIFFDGDAFKIETRDDESGNRILNCTCSFGVGFGSYKHMIRFVSVDPDTMVGGAAELA